MNKDFVPYNESLELKELGFDEECFGYRESTFGKEKVIIEPSGLITNTNFSKIFGEIRFRLCAPTFSQAFRFFRENHKLQTYIDFYHSESYFYKIKSQDGRYIGNIGDIVVQGSPVFTRTYEEAELACLQQLIQIVKNEKLTHTTNG